MKSEAAWTREVTVVQIVVRVVHRARAALLAFLGTVAGGGFILVLLGY
jgi:hypothetical protein